MEQRVEWCVAQRIVALERHFHSRTTRQVVRVRRALQLVLPVIHCPLWFEARLPDLGCSCLLSAVIRHPVVQFFLSPLLLAHGFLAVVLSNLLYVGSLAYYHYTQFLGYSGACLLRMARRAGVADVCCSTSIPGANGAVSVPHRRTGCCRAIFHAAWIQPDALCVGTLLWRVDSACLARWCPHLSRRARRRPRRRLVLYCAQRPGPPALQLALRTFAAAIPASCRATHGQTYAGHAAVMLHALPGVPLPTANSSGDTDKYDTDKRSVLLCAMSCLVRRVACVGLRSVCEPPPTQPVHVISVLSRQSKYDLYCGCIYGSKAE